MTETNDDFGNTFYSEVDVLQNRDSSDRVIPLRILVSGRPGHLTASPGLLSALLRGRGWAGRFVGLDLILVSQRGGNVVKTLERAIALEFSDRKTYR